MTAQDTAGLVERFRASVERCEPDHVVGLHPHEAQALLDALEAMGRELGHLSDPIAVHINMMRGTIAKPSIENIHHLYPEVRKEAAKTRLALYESQAEGRRKDERIKVLEEALASISYHYDNQDLSHLDFRVEAAKCARTALAARDEGPSSQNIRPNVSGDGQHLSPLDERKPNGGATHDV